MTIEQADTIPAPPPPSRNLSAELRDALEFAIQAATRELEAVHKPCVRVQRALSILGSVPC